METHSYNSVREYKTNARDSIEDDIVSMSPEQVDRQSVRVLEIELDENETEHAALERCYQRLDDIVAALIDVRTLVADDEDTAELWHEFYSSAVAGKNITDIYDMARYLRQLEASVSYFLYDIASDIAC